MDTRVKIIAPMALIGAFLGFHYLDKHYTVEKINTEWKLRIEKVQKEADKEQQQLVKVFKEKDRLKDEKFKQIEYSLNSTLNRLQLRTTRPNVVTVTEIRESCTGAQLYREDGEFLAREAARAERILTERNFYYEKYEEVRMMLERLDNG